MSKEWKVKASVVSQRISNPIRAIVDNMKVKPNPELPMVSLSIGDPTIFGNFKYPESLKESMIKHMEEAKSNGYPPSFGYDAAREAIANNYTLPEAPLTKDDVIICSGCSGAIDIAIGAIGNEGQNLLIPRPGFSLYRTLCDAKGIHTKYYDLIPEKSWEINLEQLESLIDENTFAILINNPSNPCGSNYSNQHLQNILKVAEKHRIPIISDEIYADMVFNGETFTPLASLSTNVPILTTGGLAKRWMIPGWRLGWILVHDRHEIFGKEVRDGLVKMTQLILGANSLVQSCLADLFQNTPDEYYQQNLKQLEENARYTCEQISKIEGLFVVVPKGAMYVMVGIHIDKFKDIKDDADFCEKLVAEKSVFCLPGQCFQIPNFFRIVFTPPMDRLQAAYDRLADFCEKHRK